MVKYIQKWWCISQNIACVRNKVNNDSIINSDWRKSYDWLVDLWYEKREFYNDNEFAIQDSMYIRKLLRLL